MKMSCLFLSRCLHTNVPPWLHNFCNLFLHLIIILSLSLSLFKAVCRGTVNLRSSIYSNDLKSLFSTKLTGTLCAEIKMLISWVLIDNDHYFFLRDSMILAWCFNGPLILPLLFSVLSFCLFSKIAASCFKASLYFSQCETFACNHDLSSLLGTSQLYCLPTDFTYSTSSTSARFVTHTNNTLILVYALAFINTLISLYTKIFKLDLVLDVELHQFWYLYWYRANTSIFWWYWNRSSMLYKYIPFLLFEHYIYY